MKGKKLQKQLMAMGIGRNDAAGFIRAYRVIQKAKKQELCRDIMNPPAPVRMPAFWPQNLERLRAQHTVPNEELYALGADQREQFGNRVKEKLAQGLARLLIDEAAMLFEQEHRPDDCTVFRAEIQVAMPEKRVRRG